MHPLQNILEEIKELNGIIEILTTTSQPLLNDRLNFYLNMLRVRTMRLEHFVEEHKGV